MRTGELFRRGLSEEARERGWLRASAAMAARLMGVIRDSLPDRQRMRFGDIQYDLEHNVNTTWANVGFVTRLREALIGADYQTTDPVIFAEAMEMLGEISSEFRARSSDKISSKFRVPNAIQPTQFKRFTFVDLGSGKGRVLLMAAEYGFRKIVGVELLPELDAIAKENVKRFVETHPTLARQRRAREGRAPEGGAPVFELACGDARELEFPDEPLVVFMFNPFPPWVLRGVIGNLQRSLEAWERPVYVVLHNHEHELAFADAPALKRMGGTHQFVVYGRRVTGGG